MAQYCENSPWVTPKEGEVQRFQSPVTEAIEKSFESRNLHVDDGDVTSSSLWFSGEVEGFRFDFRVHTQATLELGIFDEKLAESKIQKRRERLSAHLEKLVELQSKTECPIEIERLSKQIEWRKDQIGFTPRKWNNKRIQNKVLVIARNETVEGKYIRETESEIKAIFAKLLVAALDAAKPTR